MSVLSAFNLLHLPTSLTQIIAGQHRVEFFTSVPNAVEHLCDHIVTHPEKRLWHALALLVDQELAEEQFWTDHDESFQLSRRFWRGDEEASSIFSRLYAFYYATAVATIQYALKNNLYCRDIETGIKHKGRSLSKEEHTSTTKQWAFFSPYLHKLTLNSFRVYSLYFASAGKAENVHKGLLAEGYDLDMIIKARQSNPLPRYEAEKEHAHMRRDEQRSANKRSKYEVYASSEDDAWMIIHKHFIKKKNNVRKVLNDQFYKYSKQKRGITVFDELRKFDDWQVEVQDMINIISSEYHLIINQESSQYIS